MAFLPNGRLLVSLKGGSMVILSPDGSSMEASLNNLPAVD